MDPQWFLNQLNAASLEWGYQPLFIGITDYLYFENIHIAVYLCNKVFIFYKHF